MTGTDPLTRKAYRAAGLATAAAGALTIGYIAVVAHAADTSTANTPSVGTTTGTSDDPATSTPTTGTSDDAATSTPTTGSTVTTPSNNSTSTGGSHGS